LDVFAVIIFAAGFRSFFCGLQVVFGEHRRFRIRSAAAYFAFVPLRERAQYERGAAGLGFYRSASGYRGGERLRLLRVAAETDSAERFSAARLVVRRKVGVIRQADTAFLVAVPYGEQGVFCHSMLGLLSKMFFYK
jgi:hypothetical protein